MLFSRSMPIISIAHKKNLTTFNILGAIAAGHETPQSISNAVFQVHAHYKHSPQKKILPRSTFWGPSLPDMKPPRASQMLFSRSMPIISKAHKKKFNHVQHFGAIAAGHETPQSISNAVFQVH